MKKELETKQEYLEPVGFKGTLGKWIIDNSHKANREGLQIWAEDMIVADVVEDQHNEHKENAQLISKSKELAKALQDSIAEMKEAKRMYENVQPVGGWQGVYEGLRHAIKHSEQVLKEAGL